MDWWTRAEFGIIIHWGLYSVPGFDDIESAQRRRIQNGSEWYLDRLLKTFRETKGDKITKEFHESFYEGIEYNQLTNYFLAIHFNVEEWVNLFEKVGAKYVILTTKHHDGFCLWNTKTTDFNSVLQNPHINVVELLTIALRKRNIKVGFYYSWMEFRRNFSQKYLNEIVKPQLAELRKYKPDIWWMDGDWKATCEQWDAEKWVKQIHKDGAIINDRLGKDKSVDGDFSNFCDRYLPEKKLNVPWEHVTTIGLSWGVNYEQKEEHYKTPKSLIKTFQEVREKGGNFLLNLGPDCFGSFEKIEKSRIEEFGRWYQSRR